MIKYGAVVSYTECDGDEIGQHGQCDIHQILPTTHSEMLVELQKILDERIRWGDKKITVTINMWDTRKRAYI